MTKPFDKIFPIPLDINWHEGMLLSQHHFQQNDLRNFHVLTHQLRLLSSNHFGVCHLRIDSVALTDGLYRINEIEAIFPDGLIFSFFPDRYKNLKPLEINVKSYMPNKSSEATIYLVLAESSEVISPILGNPARYYSIECAAIADTNIKDNTVKIPRLFPNAFLSIGSIPEFCIGFPLDKIISIDGVYNIKNWTPPCFFVEKYFPLWKKCAILAASIREKATFLADKLKSSIENSVASDTENMLSKIVPCLPGLEAVVFSNEIRPYSLYEQLSEVLGSVSALVPTDIIPIMKPYDHNDIDGCIYPLVSLIDHYISTIERGYALIPFNKKDRFFYHYITSDNIDACTSGKFYIGIRGENNSDFYQLEKWIKDAIIVSDSSVETVRVKRIKGANRAATRQEIVTKILPGTGIILFEIDIDSSFIRAEQNLHIFNPGASSGSTPSEVILYLPREKVLSS